MVRLAWVLVAALVAAVLVLLLSPSARVNLYSIFMRDNRPVAPFEIAPGLYYVGASDVSVFALTSSDGIILIDAGYEGTAARVPENLRALDLDPARVRILLNTHAHMDHAAGFAELKSLTGAQLYASPRDAALLESGGRGDFFLGDWMTYPPVSVEHRLYDGEVVRLGERALTAHFTPGHTKGCTSWSFPLEVDGHERQALVLCSLSTLRYRLVDNPEYPEIAADYLHTYDVLRGLPCEVFLGAHGSWFDLRRKMQELARRPSPNPFVDPAGCRTFIDDNERKFHALLAAAG